MCFPADMLVRPFGELKFQPENFQKITNFASIKVFNSVRIRVLKLAITSKFKSRCNERMYVPAYIHVPRKAQWAASRVTDGDLSLSVLGAAPAGGPQWHSF
jgi:hypothetical protein